MISKNVLVAGAGSIIKAAWIFLFFALSARILDVNEFADFSFWLTVSVVLGLFVDFGQQTALLTRSAWSNRVAFGYVQRKLGFAYLLCVGLGLIGIFVAIVAGFSPAKMFYSAIALISATSGSIGILYCIPYRARRKYSADIKVGLTEGVTAVFGFVMVAMEPESGGLQVLLVYALARTAGALTAASHSTMGAASLLRPKLPRRVQVRSWMPFFVHLLCGTLVLNVDLLISRFVLGASDYVIYQGGMRIVHAGNLALTVINNVYIPTWTASDRNDGFKDTNKNFVRVSWKTFVLSIVAITFLTLVGQPLAVIVYGDGFLALGIFLPYFGILIALRLQGSYLGILLTCRKAQIHRMRAAIIGVTILTLMLIPWFGAYSVVYLLFSQLLIHVVMNSYLSLALHRNWVEKNV